MPFVALDREHSVLQRELHAAFDEVLRSGGFVLGEELERFEAEWARACRTSHCVGVASGTAALTLLLRASGIGPGDEVVVPALTFIATALAVVHAGATPVLCDVDPDTGLLDLDAAASAAGPRTAAIVPVHLYGQLCDMPEVARFAGRRGLAVIEDAAHAHGAKADGWRPGALSAGAAFSFYPSKNLGALGDGGAVCTNDGALAERVRWLRNLGQRAKGHHVVAGHNARLDGLQAALLSVKLRRLDAANAARRSLAERYRRAFAGRIVTAGQRAGAESVHHVFAVRVPRRDAVAEALRRDGIGVGVHYSPPLHRQPALRPLTLAPGGLPHAEAWAAEELSLPMSPALTTGEVDRAAEACLKAVAEVTR